MGRGSNTAIGPRLGQTPARAVWARVPPLFELKRVQLGVLDVEAELDRLAGKPAQVRATLPRHDLVQSGLHDRVGVVEGEPLDLAVVEGRPNPSQGSIDQPLRMDSEKYHMIVGPHPEAKKAITHFNTLRTVKDRALLEVQLETGRQHQIRAHTAWLGHPVIGDPRYGTDGPRMGLHALRLSITRPKTGKRLTFETPAPDGFLELLR